MTEAQENRKKKRVMRSVVQNLLAEKKMEEKLEVDPAYLKIDIMSGENEYEPDTPRFSENRNVVAFPSTATPGAKSAWVISQDQMSK